MGSGFNATELLAKASSVAISTITPDKDVISTEVVIEAKSNPVELTLDQNKIMQQMGQVSTSSGLVYTICDYGGQDKYDSLHYLFFTKKTLYMIVFDMSRILHGEDNVDGELTLLESWIERVVMYTEECGLVSPIMLVGTHYDELKRDGEDIAVLESRINGKIKSCIDAIIT